MNNLKLYIASRVHHARRWQHLRDIDGVHVTSSWIDCAGPDESGDMGVHWCKITVDISNSNALLLYAEPDDFPLKGALIEAGYALGCRIPIVVVLPGVELEPRNMRPIGSWIQHPLVRRCDVLAEAIEYLQVSI